MTKDQALRLALEALEFDGFTPEDATHRSYHAKAITAIKQALAQPEPEPAIYPDEAYELGLERIAYYTSPLKREWVGLTDEEIDQGLLRSDYALQTAHAWRAGVAFAEAKLKEKNT
jgi:hypothetical protein